MRDKSLIDEIDKIAKEDTKKYVLSGEGKNKEYSPEEIERRRTERRKRLYEPGQKNKNKIQEYLNKEKEKINKKFQPTSFENNVKEEIVKKGKEVSKKLPLKKIGKYAIGGTIGASKLIKNHKEDKKEKSLKT